MGRSIDSYQRARQLLVDQICSLSGGPCYYIGRDMKTSHVGLGITESEWDANLELTPSVSNVESKSEVMWGSFRRSPRAVFTGGWATSANKAMLCYVFSW
jgi:hypothetical protein